MPSIQISGTTYTPLVLEGHLATRIARNVFHDILATNADYASLRPASLRAGTLSLVFPTAATAYACASAHAGTVKPRLIDADVPQASMSYVPNGRIVVEVDTETAGPGAVSYLWKVQVDYQEVPA